VNILNKSHLSYSLNVYNLSSLNDIIKLCDNEISYIRNSLNYKNTPFALGLWLNAQVANELQNNDNLKLFGEYLKKKNYYISTINAFPFKHFHYKIVKENVYLPDWSELSRVEYTKDIIRILANLLPHNIVGSISSLPGGYKYRFNQNKIEKMKKNIIDIGKYLYQIYEQTGKKIILSFEMEPDCYWENVKDFIIFYNKLKEIHKNITPFIGVCYDTCHQEIVTPDNHTGLDLLLENRIPIGKIQFSAALYAPNSQSRDELKSLKFLESIYLHQTISIKNNQSTRWADLIKPVEKNIDNLIIHFHTPIFLDKLTEHLFVKKKELIYVLGKLKSGECECENLEIETYTYNLIQSILNEDTIEKFISKEYQWIINQLSVKH